MSLANEVNWKKDPLAGDEVNCVIKGSGVALAVCAETAPAASRSAKIEPQVRKTCFTKASENIDADTSRIRCPWEPEQ